MALVYDGSPHPSRELKAAFSQCHVEAYHSRAANGTAFYDVRAGQNTFFPEAGNAGKAYFAGEPIPGTDSATEVPAVVPSESPKAADAEFVSSEVSNRPIFTPVIPLNDAAKKNEESAQSGPTVSQVG